MLFDFAEDALNLLQPHSLCRAFGKPFLGLSNQFGIGHQRLHPGHQARMFFLDQAICNARRLGLEHTSSIQLPECVGFRLQGAPAYGMKPGLLGLMLHTCSLARKESRQL